MNQTEEIHECFYDLFNLRFRAIEENFYANVAIEGYIRPIPVHSDFQCIIVVKESKLKETPAPFLNRFEKYKLSHEETFESLFQEFPLCIQHVIKIAKKQVCMLSNIIIYSLIASSTVASSIRVVCYMILR